MAQRVGHQSSGLKALSSKREGACVAQPLGSANLWFSCGFLSSAFHNHITGKTMFQVPNSIDA